MDIHNKNISSLANKKDESEDPGKFLIFWQHYFYPVLVLEAVIILFFGYWFILKPQAAKIFKSGAELTNIIQVEQAQLSAYEQQIDNLQKIKDEYTLVSGQDISRLAEMLPAEPALKDLAMQVSRIVEASGLLLQEIDFDQQSLVSSSRTTSRQPAGLKEAAADTGDNSQLGQVILGLNIGGTSYRSLKSLLESLERNLRLIDVQKIKFSPDDGRLDLIIKAYYLKP